MFHINQNKDDFKLKELWRGYITYWPRIENGDRLRMLLVGFLWYGNNLTSLIIDIHYDVFKHQLLKQAKFMESDKAIGVNIQKIRCPEHIKFFISWLVRLMDKVYNEEYALVNTNKTWKRHLMVKMFVPFRHTGNF